MIGSVLLILLFLINKGHFHFNVYKRDTVFVILSGMAMGTSWMFLYEAYRQIGVSLASLLYYCGPVIVMAISPIVFKERLTRPKILGFLVVLVGIILVNGRSSEAGNTWGIICGAMSALMYSLMVTLNKQSRTISGLENSVIQLTVSFLTVAIFVGIKQNFIIQISDKDWLWILVLGILNTGIGCYLYFSSLNALSVQTVAICGYLEPLSAVLFAALILGERLSVIQIVGAIFIVGGAMIAEVIGQGRTKELNKKES